MRKQTKIYLALWILGAVLGCIAMVLDGKISEPLGGMLMGIGTALFAFDFSMWRTRRREEKDPQQMKQAEIEANDERNVAIRRRAQAVSGEVLQWAIMAVAWFSIGLGAPLWVTLAAAGIFVAKSVLELSWEALRSFPTPVMSPRRSRSLAFSTLSFSSMTCFARL